MKLTDSECRVLRAMARVSAECTSRKCVVVLRYALLELHAWDADIEASLCNDGEHPVVARLYDAIRRLIRETDLAAGAGDLGRPAGPRYTECWITSRGLDHLENFASK